MLASLHIIPCMEAHNLVRATGYIDGHQVIQTLNVYLQHPNTHSSPQMGQSQCDQLLILHQGIPADEIALLELNLGRGIEKWFVWASNSCFL